jgi:hypothetical protein
MENESPVKSVKKLIDSFSLVFEHQHAREPSHEEISEFLASKITSDPVSEPLDKVAPALQPVQEQASATPPLQPTTPPVPPLPTPVQPMAKTADTLAPVPVQPPVEPSMARTETNMPLVLRITVLTQDAKPIAFKTPEGKTFSTDSGEEMVAPEGLAERPLLKEDLASIMIHGLMDEDSFNVLSQWSKESPNPILDANLIAIYSKVKKLHELVEALNIENESDKGSYINSLMERIKDKRYGNVPHIIASEGEPDLTANQPTFEDALTMHALSPDKPTQAQALIPMSPDLASKISKVFSDEFGVSDDLGTNVVEEIGKQAQVRG